MGIDGEPSAVLSRASYPLGLPYVNASFDMDWISGTSSRRPGPLPLVTMIKSNVALPFGFFQNDDGHFVVTVMKSSGAEWISFPFPRVLDVLRSLRPFGG